MLDPPRRGVADSIALLQSAGVQVVMITGDAEGTAVAIANQLGMRVGRRSTGQARRRVTADSVDLNGSAHGDRMSSNFGLGAASVGLGGSGSSSLTTAPPQALSDSSTNPAVLTGAMIDSMSKAQLKERVGNVSVFARTTPKHKMAIVEAFQSRGAIVAMTGDGG